MRTQIKYDVIYRHRDRYAISTMCRFFEVSRSGYYDFVSRKNKPCKDDELIKHIQYCQKSNGNTYGYRRVWLWLKKKGVHRNPKTILRIMKKYGLLSEIRRRRKWVQMGKQIHKYENRLNRNFFADAPQ